MVPVLRRKPQTLQEAAESSQPWDMPALQPSLLTRCWLNVPFPLEMKITSLIILCVIKLNQIVEYSTFSALSSGAGCSGLSFKVEKRRALDRALITPGGFSTFQPQGSLSGSESRAWLLQLAGSEVKLTQLLHQLTCSPGRDSVRDL